MVGFISILLLVVFVIICLLFIFLVLVQHDQGDGIAGLAGGSSSQTAFGSRSGNFLTRLTSILGVLFFVIAVTMAWINKSSDNDSLLLNAESQQPEVNWFHPPDTDASGTATDSTDNTTTESGVPATTDNNAGVVSTGSDSD